MAETRNPSSVEPAPLAVSRPRQELCAPTYEQRLADNLEWALIESSKFFEERGAVHEALRRIAQRLDELGVPYAVAGGMALFLHGYRRFTEDVDILVTREGLHKIHSELSGRGYLPPFTGSKNLRDTENGVRIEFLVAGDDPGDGKPKPVAFPDPAGAAVEIDHIRFLGLPTLIERKLASGLTNPLRLQDIVDVQELIRILKLPADFADRLSPFVQDKYRELWSLLANHPAKPE